MFQSHNSVQFSCVNITIQKLTIFNETFIFKCVANRFAVSFIRLFTMDIDRYLLAHVRFNLYVGYIL